jgi:hypothetical protein
MRHRLGIVVALLVVLGVSAGCSWGSHALGGVGGCNSCRYETGSQTCSYARTWARGAQHQQEFLDTYFLNYDVNDPYRCDCPIYDYCPCGSSGACYP